MQAIETLRRGEVGKALAELQDQVRAKPQDPPSRVFLFQLLALVGQWDRALNQLQVCGQLDPLAQTMVQAYTQTIRCENLRAQVFAGKKTPLVLGEPEPWVALLLQALAHRGHGEHAAADALRDQAFEAASATPGTISWRASGKGEDEVVKSQRFEWLADADQRLGPVFEAIVDGRYYWVPVANIRTIRLEPPTDLRDLIWMPAQFVWASGGEQIGFIPTRYPGSEASDDDAIRMARKTDWVAAAEGFETGLGQRLIATDAGEYPLLDIRKVEFDAAATPTGETTAHG